MKKRRLWMGILFGALVLLGLPVFATSAGGTYFQRGKEGLVIFRLVETPGGILGRRIIKTPGGEIRGKTELFPKGNDGYERKEGDGLLLFLLPKGGEIHLYEGYGTRDEVLAKTPLVLKKFDDKGDLAEDDEGIVGEVEGKGPSVPLETTEGADISKTAPELYEKEAGVVLSYDYGKALGYRLYRSEKPGNRGISVTDFYLTTPMFADVNMEPGKTYYYTLVDVLEEAKPLEGKGEVLSEPVKTWTVRTKNFEEPLLPEGGTRRFILLGIDNPMMSLDGVEREVDPGRGTAPMIYENRTMMPIRAVVEGMEGGAKWDGVLRKVDLFANGNSLSMEIGKETFQVNGRTKELEVAPILENDRTFLPLRFVAENLNCKVEWIEEEREVLIVWNAR